MVRWLLRKCRTLACLHVCVRDLWISCDILVSLVLRGCTSVPCKSWIRAESETWHSFTSSCVGQ